MVYFIVNPASSSGKGIKLWEKVKSIVDKDFSSIEYVVYFSKESGHIQNIFDEELKNKKDIDKIVCVGGDGTLNEVINGLGELNNIPVAFIPCGTSNDFTKSMSMPYELKESIALALSENNIVDVDVCEVSGDAESRKFINGFGFGYDGQIIYNSEHFKLKSVFNKLGISSFIYMFYGIMLMFTSKRFNIKVKHDGNVSEFKNCYMVLAMVNPYEGGGIYFGPSADSSDGLTDLVIMHSKSRWNFITHLFRATTKKQAKGEGYTVIQFKEAEVWTDIPKVAQIDGESIGEISYIKYKTFPKYFKLVK